MKTSNKILIGGFGVVIILVIAFMLSGRALLNRSLGAETGKQPTAIVRISV